MSNPAFYWTPADESANETASFPRPLYRFTGFRVTDKATAISKGGVSVSTIYDTWDEYDLELRAFGPDTSASFYSLLTSWWSHASRGGEFAFAVDGDDVADTTLSAAATQGDTTVSVNSTASMAADDWLVFEDANDYAKHERRKISSISGAVVTLADALSYGFSAASTVRHAEYFPKCIVSPQQQGGTPLTERTGGNGANLWDLSVTIRTVR